MTQIESFVFNRCLLYLGYRIRSTKEIKDYIKKIVNNHSLEESFKQELVENTIKRLQELKLIDDLAFAKVYIEQQSQGKNPKGPLAIKASLAKKGISSKIVSALMPPTSQIPQTLHALAQKRLSYYKQKDHKTARQKTLHFLLSRGFLLDTAIQAIDTAGSNN